MDNLAGAIADLRESKEKWQKWRNMRYTEGNRKKFVRKFVQASRKYSEATGGPVNPKDEIYQFMTAVAGHEGRFLFYLWVLVSPNEPLAIQRLYGLFEEEQDFLQARSSSPLDPRT